MDRRNLQALFQIVRRDGKKDVVLHGAGPAIVGIQGWAGGISQWLPGGLISYAEEKDLSGKLMSLGMQSKNISYYHHQVSEQVNKFPNCTLIGISMGGLIALDWAIKTNSYQKVNQIVCIAPPLSGVAILKHFQWMCGAFCDMAPNSNLLREIKSAIIPKNKVTLVFGRNDDVVGPPVSLNQAETIVVDSPGHNYLQYHIPDLLSPILNKIILNQP